MPLSLKEELSLSASRNYFNLSANFLCRYAELSKMHKELHAHQRSPQSSTNSSSNFIHRDGTGSNKRYDNNDKKNKSVSVSGTGAKTKTCNFCHAPGHLKATCRKNLAQQAESDKDYESDSGDKRSPGPTRSSLPAPYRSSTSISHAPTGQLKSALSQSDK